MHLLFIVSKYVHVNSSVVALQKKSRDCTLIYQSLCNWKLFEQASSPYLHYYRSATHRSTTRQRSSMIVIINQGWNRYKLLTSTKGNFEGCQPKGNIKGLCSRQCMPLSLKSSQNEDSIPPKSSWVM